MAVDPNSIVKTHLDALEVGGVDVPLGGKANLGAVTDPGVNDDSAHGYGVGSVWINTAGDTAWTCVDASVGAAVWFDGGGSGGATVTAGSNGVQGTVEIFPASADSGKLKITFEANNSGDNETDLVVASQTGAGGFTAPDRFGSTSYFVFSSTGPGAAGLYGLPSIPLTTLKNDDGTTLAASASSGTFGLSQIAGTALRLVGETANSSTVTDTCSVVLTLPDAYIANANILIGVNASLTGAGTPGTHTLQALVYAIAADGSMGANVGDAAQTITPGGTLLFFAPDCSTFVAQQQILIRLQIILQETAASNLAARINSVALTSS